ncbi:MAG: aminotransferase class III-fold pyridoxal phosphate-dependent enzyme [Acidimicrobiales bacterium]
MTSTLTAPAPGTSLYRQYARPLLATSLEAVRLDKHYVRAQGDRMTYRDPDGAAVDVLDMLGGYGSTFLGHNHPELVACAQELLGSAIPIHAQASVRVAAGELAMELSNRIGALTRDDYVVTVLNTGAEAVEAAMKHSVLERQARLTARFEADERNWALLVHRGRVNPDAALPQPLATSLERILATSLSPVAGGKSSPTVPLTIGGARQSLADHNRRCLEHPACFIALEGAFHGKTSGALGLSAPEHATAFPGLSPRVIRVSRSMTPGSGPHPMAAALAETAVTLYGLVDAEAAVQLRAEQVSTVSAIFVEPVQGEGGIRPLAVDNAEAIREAADRWGVPVVADEIQSGLGRCGGFLASALVGLRADYYLLGKGLGGGIAKVAALAVERSRYQEAFGVLHTSTFSEDDFGCRLALAALTIADRDHLARRAADAGSRLRAGLEALRRVYPDVIAEVRGLGLMVGVELADLDNSASNVFRITSRQGLLTYVVAGYLLNEEGIRVAPTLGARRTLRLEPSAYVSDADIDATIAAFGRVCAIFRRSNAGRLTRSLGGCARRGDRSEIRDYRRDKAPYHDEAPQTQARVAFVGHLIDGAHLPLSDPSLADIPPERLRHFARATHRLLGPEILDRVNIVSATGQRVHLSFIALTIPSAVIAESLRLRDTAWINHRLDQAAQLAQAEGCQIMGLGGYTSIVTNNAKRLCRTGLGLTTGNALTVGMGVRAIVTAAEAAGIDLAGARVGAVGAAGNICSTYAVMMSQHCHQLVLVGRGGSLSRLAPVAHQIYAHAWARLGAEADPGGLAGALADEPAARELAQNPALAGDDPGAWLFDQVEPGPLGGRLVTLSDNPASLVASQVVVMAANSATSVVAPRHLRSGPVVICDLSVPSGVDPAVATERPEAVVIQGGIVRLPHNPGLRIGGIPLPDGHVFACMAETTLLGLAGHRGNFSFGAITTHQVKTTLDLADTHGYRLGHLKQMASY